MRQHLENRPAKCPDLIQLRAKRKRRKKQKNLRTHLKKATKRQTKTPYLVKNQRLLESWRFAVQTRCNWLHVWITVRLITQQLDCSHRLLQWAIATRLRCPNASHKCSMVAIFPHVRFENSSRKLKREQQQEAVLLGSFQLNCSILV